MSAWTDERQLFAYYNQQEELLYRNQQDRKAEHEGKIREYRTKEKEARKAAKKADNPMEQRKLKCDARTWARRSDEAEDDFRDARRKLQAEIDEYLELIEQSLQGTCSRPTAPVRSDAPLLAYAMFLCHTGVCVGRQPS